MLGGRDGGHWLTREELFEAAWDRPLTKVAAELGITSTALKKTCDRHDIPTPRRGYWAAVQSGRVFTRPVLRPVKDPRLQSVRVHPALAAPTKAAEPASAEAEDVAAAKPATRIYPPAPAAALASPPVAATQTSASKIAVPATLASPHWIIAAWIEAERRDKETYRRHGWSIGNRQPTPLEKRTRLILNGIFKAVERRGHKATTERGSIHQVHLMIAGHRFDYTLVEKYTQRRVALTAAELKLPENASVSRRFRQVRELTGQLQLTIKTSHYNKAVWRDEPERSLEDQLGEVVVGLEAMAVEETATKARQAEAERLRWEEERRRAEVQRQQRQDANQWRRLRELAQREEEVQRMRHFVDTLRGRAADECGENEEIAAWLIWAEEWIAAWDPLTDGVGAVMGQVKRVTDCDYRE